MFDSMIKEQLDVYIHFRRDYIILLQKTFCLDYKTRKYSLYTIPYTRSYFYL